MKLTIFSQDDVEDAKKSQKELLKNRIVSRLIHSFSSPLQNRVEIGGEKNKIAMTCYMNIPTYKELLGARGLNPAEISFRLLKRRSPVSRMHFA